MYRWHSHDPNHWRTLILFLVFDSLSHITWRRFRVHFRFLTEWRPNVIEWSCRHNRRSMFIGSTPLKSPMTPKKAFVYIGRSPQRRCVNKNTRTLENQTSTKRRFETRRNDPGLSARTINFTVKLFPGVCRMVFNCTSPRRNEVDTWSRSTGFWALLKRSQKT